MGIMPYDHASSAPFDAIRRVDERGEHWSARDLQPMLGYDKWERFEDAIERAKVSCANSGHNPSDHFPGAGKVIKGGRWGEQEVADYRLTRYAAYLVAMNGDPRKPEIAAAQTYFAVRTREAEVAVPAQRVEVPDLSTPGGVLAMAEMFTSTARQLVAAEAQVAELAPKAAAADAIANADGCLKMGAVANMFGIGRTTLFRILYAEKVLQHDKRPYQNWADMFRVVATTHTTSIGREVIDHTAYIYPDGAVRLHALLTRRGYVLRDPQVQVTVGEL